jgi:YD repeat-containing protein
MSYATHNTYDDSGHLVATFNPDEGLTRFKVDQKGRVHFSQTAGQRANGAAWTRTYYDQIFRVAAVGQTNTQPPATVDSDGYGVVPSNAPESTFTDLADPSSMMSINRYDTYSAGVAGEDDPVAFFSSTNSSLSALLPSNDIWGPFADGHLVQTYELDPTIPGAAADRRRTVERYFYDQDGRIVIRWVSHRDSSGNWRHFAIGIFYDFAGRVKRLVYPTGPGGDPLQVVYTYDDLGRLFAVGTAQDRAYFARYAYQPTGEVRAIIYGPGEGFVAKRMLQDPQGWLRSLAIQGR